MNLRPSLWARVDPDGRPVLPHEAVAHLGLRPGAVTILDAEPDSIRLRRPLDQLAEIYIEPTSRCSLACRTCMRDAWDETLGDMSEEIFLRALHDMQSFQPSPSVFFGGFGEPLAHPGIVEMVSRAKTAGAPRVELVTNGCFLGEEMSIRLINAGLDRLWVSLDGLQPEAFSDTRLGASLPTVLANVRDFVRARMRLRWTPHATSDLRAVQFDPSLGDVSAAGEQLLPELGIVFVATRRNIAELPRAIDEGRRLGARRFLVTNVLPYTEEVAAEILYENVLEVTPLPTHWDDEVRLPPPPHGCDGPHP